jgi:hypothetical protein
MAKTIEMQYLEELDQIKKLIMLGLSRQGIEGRRMAQVLGVDPAVISRILSDGKGKKK